MNIANLFNLSIANIDPNGRVTTAQEFQYLNKDGVKMYGKKLTLSIQNGAKIINGLDVQKTVQEYLARGV